MYPEDLDNPPYDDFGHKRKSRPISSLAEAAIKVRRMANDLKKAETAINTLASTHIMGNDVLKLLNEQLLGQLEDIKAVVVGAISLHKDTGDY